MRNVNRKKRRDRKMINQPWPDVSRRIRKNWIFLTDNMVRTPAINIAIVATAIKMITVVTPEWISRFILYLDPSIAL